MQDSKVLVQKLLDTVVFNERVPADVRSQISGLVAGLLPTEGSFTAAAEQAAPARNYRTSTTVDNIPVPGDLAQRVTDISTGFGPRVSMGDILTKLNLPRAPSVMIAIGRAMSKLGYESRRLNDNNRREHFYVATRKVERQQATTEKHAPAPH